LWLVGVPESLIIWWGGGGKQKNREKSGLALKGGFCFKKRGEMGVPATLNTSKFPLTKKKNLIKKRGGVESGWGT